MTMTNASPLLHFRAQMVRLALEVEALADLPSIRDVRGHAPELARRMRDAAMTREMVEGSERGDAISPACQACREPNGTCFPGACKLYVARQAMRGEGRAS